MDFYRKAEEVLIKIRKHHASIQTLTLAADIKDKKRMFAIVHQVLQCSFD